MTRRTKITAGLATLVVAAAAGGSAWGAIAAGSDDPNQPIPVDLPEFPIGGPVPGADSGEPGPNQPIPVDFPETPTGGLIPPDTEVPETIDPLG